MKHYARRMPRVSYAFGAYLNSEMVGVCTYGVTASPTLCTSVCGTEWRGHVLELNRLCCNSIPNLASQIVGKSLQMLPKPCIVVSYADTRQGHVGYIYQATNWLYTGATPECNEYATANGTHSRNYTLGVVGRQRRSSKHRYVYLCGDRRQRRTLLQALKWPLVAYPKGQSLRYDASAAIVNQAMLI